MSADDVCRLAQNLARNCGYAVFPVSESKRPTRPKSEGGTGCKDASSDPDFIAWMWDRWPGPLIGIATGEASGISVVDVDPKHEAAVEWWRRWCRLLLPTRCFQTRSGGGHLYFRHAPGVRNSQGTLCRGVDTRGEGGYVVSWFAAGFGCFDHSPPAPWPTWLLKELTRQAPSAAQSVVALRSESNRSIAGVVRRVAVAVEGERNAVLFWAACCCAERGLRRADIEALLAPAAAGTGLPIEEVHRTIGSACRSVGL